MKNIIEIERDTYLCGRRDYSMFVSNNNQQRKMQWDYLKYKYFGKLKVKI